MEAPDRRRPWWLWLLVLLLVLGALTFLLTRCRSSHQQGGDGVANGTTSKTEPTTAGASTGSTSSAPSNPSPTSTDSSSTAPSSGPSSGASGTTSESPVPTSTSAATGGSAGSAPTGSLTAGGTDLLPLSESASPAGDLNSYVGQLVRATGVTVQSVPADEGFWVGTSTTNRVWVQLRGRGESPYRVQKGDHVDFEGSVVENPDGFASDVGVTPAEGADLLTSEMSHIEVKTGTVALATP